MTKVYRQGDVGLMALKKIPSLEGATERPPMLAEGEVTGHRHRITEGEAKLYALASGIVILRVLSEYARLFHEEHEDIVLPMGDYEVRRQKEFDWANEEIRHVAD